jgi:hypothetical protein
MVRYISISACETGFHGLAHLRHVLVSPSGLRDVHEGREDGCTALYQLHPLSGT